MQGQNMDSILKCILDFKDTAEMLVVASTNNNGKRVEIHLNFKNEYIVKVDCMPVRFTFDAMSAVSEYLELGGTD